MKSILISLKNEHFYAIINNSKKHEFRKKIPKYKNELLAVIYATKPVGSIKGYIIFDKAIKGNIEKMVEIQKNHNYSSEQSVRSYFSNVSDCFALPVKYSREIKPISLEFLKKNIPRFTPPQSYMFIKKDNKLWDIFLEKISKTEKNKILKFIN